MREDTRTRKARNAPPVSRGDNVSYDEVSTTLYVADQPQFPRVSLLPVRRERNGAPFVARAG